MRGKALIDELLPDLRQAWLREWADVILPDMCRYHPEIVNVDLR